MAPGRLPTKSLHSEESRLRRGEDPQRGEVAPLAPAPALRSGKEGSFSKWPAGPGRTPADFSGQSDFRRPRSRDPKPALKRKPATCSPENRTRNSPRVLSPLSGYQLGIRLPWPGYGGVTQQVRPHRDLPGCAPISPTPGPAKSAATPRSATPPASWPRPHHFPCSLTPRGQPSDQGWPWLGPLVLGDFCVSASSSVRWDEVMKTPHPKELLKRIQKRTEGKSPLHNAWHKVR